MDICGRGKAIPGKEEKVQRPWGQVKLSTKTTFSESVSRLVVSDSAPLSVGFPSKDTGVHFYSLLQGIFPPQGSNPRLPHCRQMLYHLSHQGNPFRDTIKPLKVMPQHFRVEFPLPGGPPGSSVFPDDRGTHGSSWAVQWLKLDIPNAPSAGGTGSIPGWRTKIPHAARCNKVRLSSAQAEGEEGVIKTLLGITSSEGS